MTREHLVARAQAFIDLKYVARSDARQKAMGLSYIEAERQDIAREIAAFADAIFAEMAGEWNAALAEANDVLAMASVASSAEVKKFVVDACGLIRALRRPDAAPPRPATPSVEEVAREMPQAGEVAELVSRLRSAGDREEERPYSIMHEAADLITSQDAEILAKRGRAAVLQGQLDGANAKLEKQAVEIERLKARCENLRSAMNSDPDVIALRAALAAAGKEVKS